MTNSRVNYEDSELNKAMLRTRCRSPQIAALAVLRSFEVFFKKKVAKEDMVPEPKGKKAVFWGASDRMVCCSGIECDVNEFNVTSNSNMQSCGYIGTLEISVPDIEQGIFIHAFYSGHWSFAISPSNEMSDELPSWHIERQWGTTNSHSETLTIYCPSGARIDLIERIADNG